MKKETKTTLTVLGLIATGIAIYFIAKPKSVVNSNHQASGNHHRWNIVKRWERDKKGSNIPHGPTGSGSY